jgi:hypothetical protein
MAPLPVNAPPVASKGEGGQEPDARTVDPPEAAMRRSEWRMRARNLNRDLRISAGQIRNWCQAPIYKPLKIFP